MGFGFPKKEKLKSKKIIEQLFEEGAAISKYPLRLRFLKTNLSPGTKIQTAVAVPKKRFRSAVKRNRIKRLMREVYRLNKARYFNNIEGNFAFLFLYIGSEMPSYEEIEKSMTALFDQFLAQQNDEENSK